MTSCVILMILLLFIVLLRYNVIVEVKTGESILLRADYPLLPNRSS